MGVMMKQFIHFLLIIFILFTAVMAQASSFSSESFGTLPILHEGRIKPIDTFARITLKQFYGRESYNKKTATEWLATTLFDPHTAINDPVFRIEDPTLRHHLNLVERKRPLYNFTEISSGLNATLDDVQAILQKDQKTITASERDLIEFHKKAVLYTQLLRSFSLILPLNLNIPNELKPFVKHSKDSDNTFLALKKIEQIALSKTKEIVARKGEDLSQYSEAELNIVTFSYQLQLLQNAAEKNEILRIIPSSWNNQNDEKNWYSPWAIFQSGNAGVDTASFISDLKNIARAYLESDQQKFDTSIANYKDHLYRAHYYTSPYKIYWERFMNQFNPFDIGFFLAIIALITSSLWLAGTGTHIKWVHSIAMNTLASSAILQGFFLLYRIIILERPPVGTLYESIIFVSFVAALLAWICERRNRDMIFVFLGSLSAVILGLLSFNIPSSQDSMIVLSAVLNTQFWLATHVLCITLGYAWCILVAMLAHFMLWEKAKQTIPTSFTARLKSLHSLTLIALLLTSIGTILGGIWADQSWGRFWGWDPKENGALLIVLWLAWIMHAQLGKEFSERTLLALLGFTNVIVAMAWIGVNLLGVGLHSYGFTEGLLFGLGTFTIIEIFFLIYLWTKANRHAP